jgi:phage shock protein PspC (stress-responsive transcriptional regulator)
VTRSDVADLGRLRRSSNDRHIAGVAGGLARHLDIDPIIVRVFLVVAVFFGGAGLLLYAAGWLLVPEDDGSPAPLGLDDRNRSIALAGAGVLALISAVSDWAGAYWFPWPLAILAVLAVWVLSRNDRSHRPATGYGATPAEPHDTSPADPPDAPAAATYQPPGHHGTTYQPPGHPLGYDGGHQGPTYDATTWARPRNPRKRGPILFWFTMALVALAEGVLGVVDLAGADVTPSAYPALALGIIAAMLLVGSFWGRAGGLIAVGLVAAVVTGVTTAAGSWEDERIRETPGTAGEVRSSYELEAGDLVVDMSRIQDVEELDGRTLEIDGGAGSIEVVVPDGMDVSVSADVGVGEARLFDQYNGGLGVSDEARRDGGPSAPDLTLRIDLGVGEVVVRDE